MTQVLDGFCRVLELLMAAALAVMVVLVFGNVVLRYGFNSGITVSEEVSRWLFVWLTFLGAIVAMRDHAHLGSDMLVSRLPVIGKKICLVIGHLLMLYITWLLFSGALAQARINLDVQAPVTGASMAILYFAGIVFAVVAALFLAYELWLVLTGQLSDEELVMVKESEEQEELEALQAELAREHAETPAHLQPSAGAQK
ncbi:MAG: TRAP transporter small permease [Hydrogenophaga sp.]|uniref:TRAP transporter small permease n=1 Tax=Hydrogenophaga sp. TaxID=1904254 RepID=UPI0025C54AA9|nr:TRAP transporter small permease [Hydrogenophaga sp.]MBT9553339.1 TRAP transporter small permease [Hydrogenophaga sp.]